MALFPYSELLSGVRRIFTGLQGKKSNGEYEDLKTNDDGALHVALTGSNVQYDEKVGNFTVNAGATAILYGPVEFSTFRKYSISIRGVGIFNAQIEVKWSQSTSFISDSTGVVYAYERLTLKKRGDTSVPGTEYERWTDLMPARARYAEITVRNSHATDSIEIRRRLLVQEV